MDFFPIWLGIIFNNYAMSARWICDDKWPTRRVAPTWLLQDYYYTMTQFLKMADITRPTLFINKNCQF